MSEHKLVGKIAYTNLNPEKNRDPLRFQIKLEVKDRNLMLFYLTLAKKELFEKKPVNDRHYPEKGNLTYSRSDDLKDVKTLDQPGWKPHITVNWKDVPKNIENWGLANGQNITVSVDPTKIIRDNKDYLFIVVQSKELEQLRFALGLPLKPSEYKHGFHLTLALVNQVDMQARRTRENERKKRMNG